MPGPGFVYRSQHVRFNVQSGAHKSDAMASLESCPATELLCSRFKPSHRKFFGCLFNKLPMTVVAVLWRPQPVNALRLCPTIALKSLVNHRRGQALHCSIIFR
jgi:hypothetical protein